jgi:uncharacterized repeat protein (TIGR03803 family)
LWRTMQLQAARCKQFAVGACTLASFLACLSRNKISARAITFPILLLFLLPSLVFAQQHHTQSAQLYSFTDSPDGANPYQSPILRDTAGNLYGTTIHGGAGSNGTIFKLTANGKESVLYRFSPAPGGSAPNAETGVVADPTGDLYGTEAFGGSLSKGSVFRLDTAGNFSVLHSFTGGSDGSFPSAGLVTDGKGNFYGNAASGGLPNACGNGCGTVFKIDTNGLFSVLYTFTGSLDGGIPVGTLTLDSAGNLYGTTAAGGVYGFGTIFELSPGAKEQTLYSFSVTGQFDGAQPVGGLILDAVGNLYGTTYYGGGGHCFDGFTPGCGTVFELQPSGTFTVLHAFAGADDGGWCTAGLALSGNNLYGVASGGGRFGQGTVFKVTLDGAFTLLHGFSGGADGSHPMATLTLDSTGTIYGTTAGGGTSGFGSIFKFVP